MEAPGSHRTGVRRERDSSSVQVVGLGRRPLHYTGSDGWASRILSNMFSAAAIGAGAGLAVGAYKGCNVLKWTGILASNFALVSLSFSAAQELVREIRASEPEDPGNCVLGGLATGAVLGRLQGGPSRVIPSAVIFAVVGTSIQAGANYIHEYRINRLLAAIRDDGEMGSSKVIAPLKVIDDELSPTKPRWSFPEWSPIQMLDEEAAAKRKLKKQQELRDTLESLHKGEIPVRR